MKNERLGWRHPHGASRQHLYKDNGEGEAVSLCGIWQVESTDDAYFTPAMMEKFSPCRECKRRQVKYYGISV